MNELELKERITNLVMEAFLSSDDKNSPAARLLRAGVEREVTENILRLTEDFYAENSANEAAKKEPDSVEIQYRNDHNQMLGIMKKLTEVLLNWKSGSISEYTAMAGIYSLMKNEEFVE